VLKINEEDVKEFATVAAPVIRQLEKNTGTAARSPAISVSICYSYRTTQRMLCLAEYYGYFQRTGKGKATRWTLAPTFPLPLPVGPPRIHQLQLPLAFAA
jgi:hypothetical protein